MATEKRLIDANALEFEPDENCIANGVLIWCSRSGGKTMTTVLSALKKMVDNAPTVDAVEVVRCKGCEHYDPLHIRPFLGSCAVWDTVVSENGFCHKGERRTNARE